MARIVDLTRMLAGPFGTMVLGDLGFEIIKVEEKKIGDYTRHTPPYRNGLSAYFFAANRNKKSIIVDLKRPEGRNIILDLVRTADAVVENFRPGVMEHLGLDYGRLMDANPQIILVSVNGFGSTGPLRDKTSFDLVAQAMSGAMALTTPDDGEPIKPAIPLGDVGGGLFAALGVVRALLERKITGRGKHLEVSLLDAMLAQAACVGEQFLLGASDSERPVRLAPNGVFPTADGFIALAAYTDIAWAALCKALGCEQWQDDPRYRTMADRSNAAEEIRARVNSILAGRSTAHWLQTFSASAVPACPIANLQMVFDNPELEARGMLPSIPNMVTGPLRTFGNPIQRHGRPYRAEMLPPPLHGQHTEEILSSILAYSPERIKELMESGAVAGLQPESAGAVKS